MSDLMCSQPGCKEEATHSFVWPWGQEGTCCSLHRTHVQQKAVALDRGPINFTTLDPGRPQPISRDERTRLRAEVMVANEEILEVKTRAQELYKSNTELGAEVRRLRARDSEAQARIRDLTASIAETEKARDEALARAVEAEDEVKRLKAAFVAPGSVSPDTTPPSA